LRGGIIDANDAFLELTGYSRDDLRGGLVRWDTITPPEWRAATEHARQQAATTGVTLPYEKEYQRKDGTRVPVLVGGVVPDPEEPNICIAFAFDITAQKEAQRV